MLTLSVKGFEGIITNEEYARRVHAGMMQTPNAVLAFDTETTGWNPRKEKKTPYGRALCAVFSLSDGEESWCFDGPLLGVFKPLLQRSDVTWRGANLKFDGIVCHNHNIRLSGHWSDLVIQSKLYNVSALMKHGLKETTKLYRQVNMLAFGHLTKMPRGRTPTTEDHYEHSPFVLARYARDDAYESWHTGAFLENGLAGMKWHGSKTMLDYYWEFEAPFTQVLRRMEDRGVNVNQEKLAAIAKAVAIEREQLQDFFEKTIHDEINLRSAAQVSKLLFDHYGLDPQVFTDGKVCEVCGKDATKRTDYVCKEHGSTALVPKPATNKWALQNLLERYPDHPGVLSLRRYRKVDHLAKNFLPHLAVVCSDGKVRTSWFQLGAETGRLACVDGATQLATNHGTFEISKLDLTNQKEYTILTHKGRQRRILQCFPKGEEMMFEVRTRRGHTLVCTREHRLLTPGSWRPLGSLNPGEAVLSSSYQGHQVARQNQEPDEGPRRGELPPTIPQGETDETDDDSPVWGPGSKLACLRDNKGSVCSGVQNRVGRGQIPQLLQGSALSASQDKKGTCQDNPTRATPEMGGRGSIGGLDGPGKQDIRLLCSPKSGVARRAQGEWATTAEFAACDDRVLGETGELLPRATSGSQNLPYRRGQKGLLRPTVQSVHTNERASVVCAGASKCSSVLPGSPRDAEGPHQLESEQARDAGGDGPAGARCTARAPVLGVQAVHGGLPAVGLPHPDRDRRAVPRQARVEIQGLNSGDRVEAQRVPSPEVPNQRGAEGPRRGAAGYSSSPFVVDHIVSIKPVGVLPVWDLVVEGDHSYVAQGLVHHNSGSPNLMNMTRSENDDPLHPNPMQRGFGLRDLFEPDEGHSFVVADYSQVELRLGAHISRDPVMIETYRRGGDIHAQAAIALFGLTCKEDEVAKLFPGERTKAKCFHPDTEVLTKVGWQRIVDIDESVEVMQAEPGPGCAVELSWTHPLQVFTQYHPDRRLVHLKNEGIDLRVTPDHRMVGFGVTGKPKVVPPDRLGKVRHWANAGMLNNRHGCPERPDERVLRLAVATQADGSFTPGHVIRFGFTKKRKIDRILKLLNEGEYTTSVSRVEPKDVTNVCVQRELADSIKSLLDKKSFPWRWLAMAPDLRDVVLDEARRWDGHDRDAWRMSMFLSTDRQSLDVLQALAAITNRKTRLAWPASKCGRLSIRDTHKTRGGNLSTKEIPWTDKVACLAVPSSYVLVRDGIAQIPVIVGQTFNFGIFYGAGANRVANEFRISKEEAKERIDAYFERFQGIKHLKTSVEHEARTKGYLRSLLGRYRHLPYIHRIAEKDLDWQMRQDDKMRSRYSGEFREALNFGPQGGAADCIQTAMLIADGEYVEWHPLQQDTRLLDLDATMLMQIHDELVLQAPTENAERAARALERVMTDPLPGLLVPILADAGYGGTWTSAKKAS